MTEKEAYIDIAGRYINSCEEQLQHNIDIQEAIGFQSYHAFESIGGAYLKHYGQTVPKGHEKKLNAFVAKYSHTRLGGIHPSAIASNAIFLNSMRNKYLYPWANGTSFTPPKEQITLNQVSTRVAKIKGIINKLLANF